MNTIRTVLVAVAAVTLAVLAFQAFSFAFPQQAWAQGSMTGNGQMSGNQCPHMNGQGMMGQGVINGGMMGMGNQQQMMKGQHMMNGQNHQQCQQYMNDTQMNAQQCQAMRQYCQP